MSTAAAGLRAPTPDASDSMSMYPRVRVVGYRRTPKDVLRVVVMGVAALVLLAVARWATDALLGLEEDLIRLLGFLGSAGERIVAGLLNLLLAITGLVILVTPLVTRRYRLFGYVVAGQLITTVLVGLGTWWVERSSATLENQIAQRAGVDTDQITSELAIGQLAAMLIVIAPFVTHRWRVAGTVAFWTIVVARLLTAAHLPADIFFAIAAGAMVGSLVLFLFGRPDERATDEEVIASLRRSGLPMATIDPAKVDARGSTPYFGALEDGSRIFAKVLGAEERSADLLFRIYRFLRFRNLDDEKPFSTLRRAVEHEAFISLQARDLGVRTPRIRAVASVSGESFLLAYDRIEGDTLDKLDPGAVTDELLAGIWGQVAILRDHRIAHRDLRRANILVDPAGTPWLIDFGFAEVAATDRLLASDVAQLISALAVIAGAERTVSSAIAALGADAVAGALPRLQIGAMSGATQSALKEHPGLLTQLRQVILERTGATEIEPEPIERLNIKSLLTILMLIGVVYFLLPQFADLPAIWDNVKSANWWWLLPMVACSAATYVAATFSFMGAIPDRLPFGPTLATQSSSSFVGKVAPAGLGGMALNIRYAQKAGVDPAVAVTGVGLNSLGGLVMHVTLILLFGIWAGSDAFDDLNLPDPKYFLYGAAGVAVLAVVAITIPWSRRLITTKLLPILARSVKGVATVVRSPAKLALLLGGSMGVTGSYITCLFFGIHAFGGDIAFSTLGLTYLLGAALATAAPTPGGLGPLEAALIAGLTAAGVDSSVAVPAVFLYRVATFWMPILPGWAAFSWLKRAEYV